jgi:hypothetical protein
VFDDFARFGTLIDLLEKIGKGLAQIDGRLNHIAGLVGPALV